MCQYVIAATVEYIHYNEIAPYRSYRLERADISSINGIFGSNARNTHPRRVVSFSRTINRLCECGNHFGVSAFGRTCATRFSTQ